MKKTLLATTLVASLAVGMISVPASAEVTDSVRAMISEYLNNNPGATVEDAVAVLVKANPAMAAELVEAAIEAIKLSGGDAAAIEKIVDVAIKTLLKANGGDMAAVSGLVNSLITGAVAAVGGDKALISAVTTGAMKAGVKSTTLKSVLTVSGVDTTTVDEVIEIAVKTVAPKVTTGTGGGGGGGGISGG